MPIKRTHSIQKIIVIAMLGILSLQCSVFGNTMSEKPIDTSKEKEEAIFPGTKTTWNGFAMYESEETKIVVPKEVAPGRPWIWRARFWDHEPQFDVEMLKRGYHVAYRDVAGLLGGPEAVARWDSFYDYLVREHGFAKRAVLEGLSRGGLIIYNWAIANPDKVAVIYGDAPVMDFKSWPGGFGESGGSPGEWEKCLASYDLTEEQALVYKGNPIDNLAVLAKAGIPIIHVVGDVDTSVPVSENTAIGEARYKALGGTFKVIHKPDVGHHPHSLPDPAPMVEFVEKYSR